MNQILSILLNYSPLILLSADTAHSLPTETISYPFLKELILKMLDWQFLFFIFCIYLYNSLQAPLKSLLDRSNFEISWGDKKIKIGELEDNIDKEIIPMTERLDLLESQLKNALLVIDNINKPAARSPKPKEPNTTGGTPEVPNTKASKVPNTKASISSSSAPTIDLKLTPGLSKNEGFVIVPPASPAKPKSVVASATSPAKPKSDASRVIEVLADPRYRYRTLEGISVASGIKEDKVLKILSESPGVMVNKSKNGQSIFSLDRTYQRRRFFSSIRKFQNHKS
ncbi:hypothetical protein [Rheinheimera sp.]|uniref:hypothetical protein n=1 Tax=Rheinheimera sp. TaxID=1869214 RepID=UPI00307D4F34